MALADPGTAAAALGAVLGGAAACAVLATASAILAFDRRTSSIRMSRQMAFASLYVVLTALYAGALSTGDPRVVANVGLFLAAAAFALWQIASERLPLLLDPEASPPRRLSFLHALLVAEGFMILNRLLVLVASRRLAPALALAVGLATALAVALAVSLLVLRCGAPRCHPC